jgi:cation diffusion facilitator CzcD-associated flavoprotein CzcO
MKTVPDYDTVIVGAGFSGIGTAIKLDKSGLSDYLVIEAGDGPGGTWYWNTYPGIAVDIPSFSYQFSFEQSPKWSRTYAPGKELRGYAEHCVDKYGRAARSGSAPRCSAPTSTRSRTSGASAPIRVGRSPPGSSSTPAECSSHPIFPTSMASTPSPG